MNPQFTKKQYDDFFTSHDVGNAAARAQFEKEIGGQGTSSYYNPWEKGFGPDGKPLGVSFPVAQPLNPNQSFVSDSSSIRNEHADVASTIGDLAATDPFTEDATKTSTDVQNIIKQQRADLIAQQDQQDKQIEADYQAGLKTTADAQNRETGTTNVALQRVGGYLGTQMSGVGVLNNLEHTHQIELASLKTKRDQAIAAAHLAIKNNDTALAKDLATEIKDLNKTIYDRKNKFFEQALAISHNNMAQTKSQQDTELFKRTTSEKTSQDIAGIVSQQLGGDFTSPEAQKFITDTAAHYGIDANTLYSTVKEFDTKKNLDLLNTYTTDKKNYDIAVQQGYKGTLMNYLAWKANVDNKVAAAASTGASLGLPPDSPIYFATVGTSSDKLREAYIGQYAEMVKAGKKDQAQAFVDRLIYQSLPAAQKTEFQTYNSSLQVGTRALSILDGMKTKDFNVYKTALEGAKPLAVLERDQKWVDAVAKIELAQAQIRRAFFGTAVTDAEKSSADGFLIDKSTDDLASARTKLKGLMDYAEQHKLNYFQSGLGQYETGGNTPPTATMVKIGGKDITVGSIIQNSKGKKGMVNADGTITPL